MSLKFREAWAYVLIGMLAGQLLQVAICHYGRDVQTVMSYVPGKRGLFSQTAVEERYWYSD